MMIKIKPANSFKRINNVVCFIVHGRSEFLLRSYKKPAQIRCQPKVPVHGPIHRAGMGKPGRNQSVLEPSANDTLNCKAFRDNWITKTFLCSDKCEMVHHISGINTAKRDKDKHLFFAIYTDNCSKPIQAGR